MQFGLSELDNPDALNQTRIRRPGVGRKSALASIEGIDAAFLKILAEYTAGSPMNEKVKWTHLTRQAISQLLKHEGIEVSVSVVDQLLKKHNYRKRKAQKRIATGAHPQRNE